MGHDRAHDTTRADTGTPPMAIDPRIVTISKHLLSRDRIRTAGVPISTIGLFAPSSVRFAVTQATGLSKTGCWDANSHVPQNPTGRWRTLRLRRRR